MAPGTLGIGAISLIFWAFSRGHTISIETPTTTLPAGWYTDPGKSGGKRWWDGTKWTEHLRMPEAPKTRAAATGVNPYGITTVNPGGYVPADGANASVAAVEQQAEPISNRAAGLAVFFGLLAVVLTLVAALPYSPTLWICGASALAVFWGARAILRRSQGRATNLWAPVLGIVLGISAAAVVLLGINVIGMVNSATGGILPTGSTTGTPSVTHAGPRTSPEPFVFAGNRLLTTDGQAAQQVATALNRTYASGNPTLGEGQSWPKSLTFSDGQLIDPSGVTLAAVPVGHRVTYQLSPDRNSYTLSVTTGTGSEIAMYLSATNSFGFTCPATDANCVPVR